MNNSLFTRAESFFDRIAIVDDTGFYTYEQLLHQSKLMAIDLMEGVSDLHEARVAFLVPPGFEYVVVQWGIWRAGGIAVPLAVSHPAVELEYVINDCDATVVVSHPQFKEKLSPVTKACGVNFKLTTELPLTTNVELPIIDPDQRAMIIYTSGTTGKPKGVVTTHRNTQAQVTSLVDAWGWTPDDEILNVLPLHHVHGIINVLTCALWVGATCHFLTKFDSTKVWEQIMGGRMTLFMAVPSIYARLITEWEAASFTKQAEMTQACLNLRLMVSGSAALPVSVLEKWFKISNHTLLERYGMTEIGMALSNPLHGERVPGHVGKPLGNVEIRLVGEGGVELKAKDQAGEIQVKGPSVFREYWRQPTATEHAFQDGWFRTGDIATVREDGAYRILGRNSVDIIKTGGFKVSALEIEEVLRLHPAIQECAVVGVEDVEWGERICAALILGPTLDLRLRDMRRWAKERLAPYKIPSRILVLKALPHNVMGKVIKPEVKKLFEI